MKKAVRIINELFIVIVLALFYLVVIGLTSIFLKISRLFIRREKALSYWQKGMGGQIKRSYFESAY